MFNKTTSSINVNYKMIFMNKILYKLVNLKLNNKLYRKNMFTMYLLSPFANNLNKFVLRM